MAIRPIIYVSPEIEEFLKNPDALSQDITIFKNGGIVNGKKAIPYIALRNKTMILPNKSMDADKK